MLDLQNINNQKFYEVRLLNGTELQLKRPTQAMFEFVLSIQDFAEKGNDKESIKALSQLFTKILNRNANNIQFKEEELAAEYDFNIVSYLISDYFGFWNKDLSEQVNFHQSQQER